MSEIVEFDGESSSHIVTVLCRRNAQNEEDNGKKSLIHPHKGNPHQIDRTHTSSFSSGFRYKQMFV